MGVHHALVKLENLIANPIEEITVVSYHEQRHARLGKEFLQPFNHFHIEVVGGLVKDKEIWFMKQHQGQSQAFHLSTRELVDHLVKVGDGKTSQILPCFKMLFFVEVSQQIRDARPFRIHGQLLQVADFDIVGIGDGPRIGRLLPHQDL